MCGGKQMPSGDDDDHDYPSDPQRGRRLLRHHPARRRRLDAELDRRERGALLTLQVRGARRFHVRRTRVRDNGLVIAQVEWCDPDPDDELRPEHAVLGALLQGILEQFGGEHAAAPRARFDDAAWVGWRLSELLPLADDQRQILLQEDDPHARLDRLLDLLP